MLIVLNEHPFPIFQHNSAHTLRHIQNNPYTPVSYSALIPNINKYMKCHQILPFGQAHSNVQAYILNLNHQLL